MKNETRKKWKRVLALLLTVVMCLSLIPANAFAQEGETSESEVIIDALIDDECLEPEIDSELSESEDETMELSETEDSESGTEAAQFSSEDSFIISEEIVDESDIVDSYLPESIESEEKSDASAEETDVASVAAVNLTTVSYAPYPNIEYGYTSDVSCGTIRYISQTTSGSYYHSEYWDEASGSGYTSPGYECGTACISMALSYVGVNYTPEEILNAHDGYTYFTGWSGADTLSPGLSTAISNYVNGSGKYSPVIIHLSGGTYSTGSGSYTVSTSSNSHYLLIIAQVSSTTYLVLDPSQGNTPGTTFQITTGSSFYSGIDQVYQYYNSSASLDTTAPVISNVQTSSVSSSGYTVTCIVTDNVGIDRVQFPTWTTYNDQDDLDSSWSTSSTSAGTISGSTVTFRVNASDHNNESGTYVTDIYAYDTSGNVTTSRVVVTVPEKPEVMNVTISDVSEDGYTVTCEIKSDVEIDRVQFPTWTSYNGQDDLTSGWKTSASCSGTMSGNSVTYRVYTSDHDGETGVYRTHIYAYDIYGNVSASYHVQVYIGADGEYGADPVLTTTYDGSTYVLLAVAGCSGDLTDWQEAAAYCQSIGGHLVTITSAEENSIVAEMVASYGQTCWIGANDIETEGTFVWDNGETFSYSNWDSGQPDNYGDGQDCVQMYTSGYWDDNYASSLRAFVCEFEYAPCEHEYESVSIPATCLVPAHSIYTCKLCGESYVEYEDVTYSDWSETYPEGINDGLVESQAEYRYYTYETQTVTSVSSLSGDGWELVSTNTYWSDYGSWSAWQDTSVSSSDSRKVESRKVYRYYYFYCPVCGGREPLQGLSDCHSYTLTQSDAVEGWFTTSYADSNSQTYSYTTIKRYTTSLGDGLIWNFSTGNLSDTAAGTIDSDSEAVVIKMQYRYCTRSQVTEYTYQRASEWSEWTTDTSELPSDAVTESRTVYRYITSGLGEHSWDEGVVTTEPTTDSVGIRTYTCTVCGDTKEETIDKLAAITINTQPEDYTGTAGSTASFTVIASGSGLSYKWQYSDDGGVVWNDSIASSASSMTYKLTMTAARDGRMVRCVITDVNGNSVTSATAKMILETSLEITSQPTDYSGTVGSMATFTVVAEGTGLTYQWQYSDDSGKTWVTSTASSAKAATYTSTLTTARDGRMVRCIVTDANGNSVTSDTAAMTVKSAISIVSQPSDYTGTAGSKASFTVVAQGTGLTYQWQYSDNNGASWVNSTASSAYLATYTSTMTAARDGRMVRCIVTDVYGSSVTSDAATMYLEAATALSITGQPSDYTGAVGSIASFTVTATGTGLTYQWQYSDDNGTTWVTSTATSAKAATYTSTLTAARDGRMVRCIVTDASGNSVTSDAATMSVQAALTITTQPVDYTGSAGSTATFTIIAEGTGLTYQWQYSDSNGKTWSTSTATSAKSATYTSTLTAARDGRKVRCVVTDADGNMVTSDEATMRIG